MGVCRRGGTEAGLGTALPAPELRKAPCRSAVPSAGSEPGPALPRLTAVPGQAGSGRAVTRHLWSVFPGGGAAQRAPPQLLLLSSSPRSPAGPCTAQTERGEPRPRRSLGSLHFRVPREGPAATTRPPPPRPAPGPAPLAPGRAHPRTCWAAAPSPRRRRSLPPGAAAAAARRDPPPPWLRFRAFAPPPSPRQRTATANPSGPRGTPGQSPPGPPSKPRPLRWLAAGPRRRVLVRPTARRAPRLFRAPVPRAPLRSAPTPSPILGLPLVPGDSSLPGLVPQRRVRSRAVSRVSRSAAFSSTSRAAISRATAAQARGSETEGTAAWLQALWHPPKARRPRRTHPRGFWDTALPPHRCLQDEEQRGGGCHKPLGNIHPQGLMPAACWHSPGPRQGRCPYLQVG